MTTWGLNPGRAPGAASLTSKTAVLCIIVQPPCRVVYESTALHPCGQKRGARALRTGSYLRVHIVCTGDHVAKELR